MQKSYVSKYFQEFRDIRCFLTTVTVIVLRMALILTIVRYCVSGDGGQYFRVTPRNSSVLEGGEVTIPCEVENRYGTVQWVKDGFAYVIGQCKYTDYFFSTRAFFS